jgi:hypothetical protein
VTVPSARRRPRSGIYLFVKLNHETDNTTAVHLLHGEADEECRHPATEYLGTNQSAEFLRCELCSAVLVRQGDRLWIVPPKSAPETQAE